MATIHASTLDALTPALAALPTDWAVLDVAGPEVRGLRSTLVVGAPGVFVVLPASAPRGRQLDRLLTGLVSAADSVSRASGVRRDEVHSVLCVSDEGYIDAWRLGVAVCGPAMLADNLMHRRPLLSDGEVDEVARALTRALSLGGRHRKAR
jgi:hypothetical protein